MVKKAKRPRSEKQLANDKRLAENAAKKRAEKEIEAEATKLASEVAGNDKVMMGYAGEAEDLPDDPSIASVPAGVTVPSLNDAVKNFENLAGYKPTYDDIESNPLYPMFKQLQDQMERLMAANANVTPDQKINQLAQMGGAQIGNQGVMGQHFKYPVDENYYPNPVEQLYDDPTLRRFALRENFFIKWEVTGVNYEKSNITFIEPRFEVALYRYMYDEDGEPNGKMFLVGRTYLHEDEVFARMAASQLKMEQGIDFNDIPDMLNKIRLIRIQRWLRESFKPINIKGYAKKSNTMVIDGRQVEVFDTEEVVEKEIAEEQAATIRAQTQINRSSY